MTTHALAGLRDCFVVDRMHHWHGRRKQARQQANSCRCLHCHSLADKDNPLANGMHARKIKPEQPSPANSPPAFILFVARALKKGINR